MGRGIKTCNGDQWTDARFHQFITGALRNAHSKWGPACRVKQKAQIKRGIYRCAICNGEVPTTIPSVYKSGKKKGQAYRKKNVFKDHRSPVVDPEVGFVDWNTYIERMYREEEDYDLICGDCHDAKTAKERVVRAESKKVWRRQ